MFIGFLTIIIIIVIIVAAMSTATSDIKVSSMNNYSNNDILTINKPKLKSGIDLSIYKLNRTLNELELEKDKIVSIKDTYINKRLKLKEIIQKSEKKRDAISSESLKSRLNDNIFLSKKMLKKVEDYILYDNSKEIINELTQAIKNTNNILTVMNDTKTLEEYSQDTNFNNGSYFLNEYEIDKILSENEGVIIKSQIITESEMIFDEL
jgi:hypothetical protein